MSTAVTGHEPPARLLDPVPDPRPGTVPALVRHDVPAHLPASVHVAARAADSRRSCAWSGTEGADVHAGCAVDVTTADVRASGLDVTRVVVPGTVANAAAGLPLLGSTRLEACLRGRARRVLPLPH